MSKEAQNGTLEVSEMLQRIGPGADQLVKNAQKAGTPIFTINDLRTTQHSLAQMARLFVIRNEITKETFEQRHREMAMQTFMSTNNMNYDRNNMRRSLSQPDITWNFLEKFLAICGFDIADVSITLTHRETGMVSTLNRADVQRIVQDAPYHPSIMISRVDKVTE